MKNSFLAAFLVTGLGLAGSAVSADAQSLNHSTNIIHQRFDDAKRMRLQGNIRPEANAANDQGPAADSFAINHMQLLLKRSAESEAALTTYIDQLQDPKSSNFHKWLTPQQFAVQYGVSSDDVAQVTAWLTSHGLTVNGVAPTGLMIDFSGTAKQVNAAFGANMHKLSVNGVQHFANMDDPQIPAAFQNAVAGVVALHDFRPSKQAVQKPKYTYALSNSTAHAVVPGDLATIYNLTPLFAAGYSGRGQTIMVVEDTYVYTTADWTAFRKTFGLSRTYPYGTFTQVSPTGALTCTNPGFQGKSNQPGYGDDGEAILDAEWATAAAPNAAIVLAACTDTSAFGGLIALVNTLNGPSASLPSVVSISYGEAETANGAAANLAYYSAYQQAVGEGVSIFVSSGDELAASEDNGNVATHGIQVSGFATTPYNVAVGGTDFGYTPDNVDPSTYWSSTNTASYSSALSYIQEIPWNDSCAGSLIASYLGTTPLQLCNNSAVTSTSGGLHFLLNSEGGSGGPSNCATGTVSTRGVVSGTCAGYPKPSWQSGIVGNPTDGVRDIPDVSLFASNGLWDAYYVVCWSNPDTNVGGGANCNGAPSTWDGFGGTSVSSPIMAGIQALVNQKTGSRWGNPNIQYYLLANQEYGPQGSQPCNSTSVNKTSNTCYFYDITEGDITAACRASGSTLRNCYRPSGTYGILSTSNTMNQPAYTSTTGWDFATGIGSVNAYNLVMHWPIPQ